MTNWKTTAAGAVAILGGLTALVQLLLGELDPAQAWPIITAAVAAGTGLLNARDSGTPAG